MHSIYVNDDLFSKQVLDYANFMCNHRVPHYATQWSVKGKGTAFYIHEFDLDNVNKYSLGYFNNEIINLLYTRINDCISNELSLNVDVLRGYINIQYAGQDGDFHYDDSEYTALLMLSETNNNGCQFEYKNGETVESIPFKQGRLIVFPHHINHRGVSSTNNNYARITLAFKLKLI